MIYLVTWTAVEDRDDSERAIGSGWLRMDARSQYHAEQMADDLMDVDFMSPGRRYSASNADVIDGGSSSFQATERTTWKVLDVAPWAGSSTE